MNCATRLPFLVGSLAVLIAGSTAAAQRAYVFSKGCSAPLATNRLYELDLQTGAVTDLGSRGECNIEGLAIVDGRLIASTESSSFNPQPQWGFWDFTEAPGHKVGPFPFVQRFGVDHDIEVDPTTGILYALQGADSRAPCLRCSYLYEIDPVTYEHTIIGSDPRYVDSIAINSRGEAFAADDVFTHTLYRVDLTTGLFDPVGRFDLGGPGTQVALGFDEDDRLWLIASGSAFEPSRIYRMDTTTGQATFITNIQPQISGVAGFNVDSLAMILDVCPADCDGSGALDFFDFMCFQNLFDAADPSADCDGSGHLDFFDFLCFQAEFTLGCP